MDKRSRNQRIREVFTRHGGAMSMGQLASLCLAEGVFDDRFLDAAVHRAAQKACRDALKEDDPITGLPHGLPTRQRDEDGQGPVWKQLSLLDYDELAVCITENSKALVADWRKLVRLRDYCLERFGKAPEIPDLRVLTTV